MQEVCEVAIQAKDGRDNLQAQLERIEKETMKLELQLRKMEIQLDLSKEELRKLSSYQQDDSLVSVDSENVIVPASTSEWDTEEVCVSVYFFPKINLNCIFRIP